ncbi:DUF4139 domain-containing protein [Kitasatospora sp. NPDC093806]|uniref:DUF4139 domain-containing protein n=1 Tax=Kitasatospora sp. NPDC093806 TaxID=3155075 RepID=UPI00341DBAE1
MPSVPSVLDSVVVHAAGAVCRRRTRVAVPPGGRLRLTGLPKGIDQGSLRARVLAGPAGAAVTEARLEAVTELREPSELPELRRELNEARERESALRERHRLVLAAIDETAALRAVPPARRRDEQLRRTPADAWLELAEFVDERLTALHGRAEELHHALELAQHETELLTDRLARSSSADRSATVETAATVLLTLALAPPPTAEGAPGPGPDGDSAPAPAPGPDGASDLELELELEYAVPAARWVPSYRLSYRSGADTGRLVLRASVAQLTGEDWTGVRLALSTADLDRRTDLPKLRSLRIGRSQPTPPPSGWREPPAGLSDLFAGYDAVGPRPLPGGRGPGAAATEPRPAAPVILAATPAIAPAAATRPQAPGGLRSADEPPAFAGYGGPAPSPAPPPPPAPAARSARARRAAAAPEGLELGGAAFDAPDFLLAGAPGGSGAAPAPSTTPPAPPVPDDLLLDYPALELLGPDAAADRRGTLRRPSARPGSAHRTPGAAPYGAGPYGSGLHNTGPYDAGLHGLPLPHHAVPPRVSAGSFDHRFDAAAPADIPSDATWHTVTIDEIPVSVRPEYVTVPSVEEKVYATLVITNPTERAVLAGPVELTVDDRYLLTAALPTLAPGGVRRLGIGVDESVEVTRRTELRESTAGMLNSSTVLDHRVHVELANRLGRPITVEVRERVPVSSDADVRIEERADWHAPAEPSPDHPAGTRLWRVDLPPGGRAELDGGYQIKIPAGKAIVGGNRRN